MNQELMDRAHEWVGEHHPDLTGPAYEKAIAECVKDLEAIDAEADELEFCCCGRRFFQSAGHAGLCSRECSDTLTRETLEDFALLVDSL